MVAKTQGYNGKLLRVDLASGTAKAEALEDPFCRRWIGGAGFITYFLWKELKPHIDALSPDNKLIFALGPVTGLALPGAARNCVGAKSPLTGGIAKSEAGGFWAPELKRAGFDAIIVENRADRPVYVVVQDGEVAIKDASSLWGLETKETEEAIKSQLSDDHFQLLTIGPGGENLVRYACIMHGLHDAAGRGGLGAVMGSKNLKAIAVRGHNLPPVANGEKVKEIRLQLTRFPHPISEFGTGGPEMVIEEPLGNLPIHNFRDGLFPEVKQINAVEIKNTIRIGMEGCFACPIRCKKIVKFEEPYRVDPVYGGPEYETLAALGSDCGVGDLKAIVKGNERCNAYSLDTISTGSTIAFAMECFEKGLLSKKDTGGLDLRWGNAEAVLAAIDLIAKRRGFGNQLAEGTARLAKKIGPDSERFAIHVKGLEPGMHEPRLRPGLRLGYSLNPHGADHCAALIDDFFASEMSIKDLHPLGILSPLPIDDISPRKVELFRLEQLNNFLKDMLVVCKFPPYNFQNQAEVLEGVTGWDTGVVELLKAAERTLTTARLFNLREGFSAADDELPERFFQPKTNGGLANKYVDRPSYEKAKSFYYSLMGWDQNGVPLPEKVEELCID